MVRTQKHGSLVPSGSVKKKVYNQLAIERLKVCCCFLYSGYAGTFRTFAIIIFFAICIESCSCFDWSVQWIYLDFSVLARHAGLLICLQGVVVIEDILKINKILRAPDQDAAALVQSLEQLAQKTPSRDILKSTKIGMFVKRKVSVIEQKLECIGYQLAILCHMRKT